MAESERVRAEPERAGGVLLQCVAASFDLGPDGDSVALFLDGFESVHGVPEGISELPDGIVEGDDVCGDAVGGFGGYVHTLTDWRV